MEIWKKIISKLEEECKVILLLVGSHLGSSPGKQGFKMMVSDDGYLFGSIGGGRTEFEMVEMARKLFLSKMLKPFLKNQIHREDENDSSGMVCAGEQLVIFYPLYKNHISTIQKIIDENKGVLTITPKSFNLDIKGNVENDFYFTNDKHDFWKYQENVNRKSKIYIIGGGHVGLATSNLFASLDFDVTVFENRKNINTFDVNNSADYKNLIDYNNITDYIDEGNNSFIIILTHGHQIDKLVLGKLLLKHYRYIGLLGSKSKVNKMFNAFVKEGFDRTELDRVDAPIGMEIGSKTPAEIAVSIAAKIIKIKNSK